LLLDVGRCISIIAREMATGERSVALYSLYTNVSSSRTLHGFNPLPHLDSILQGNLIADYFGNFKRDKDAKTGSWRWHDTGEGEATCDSFLHLHSQVITHNVRRQDDLIAILDFCS
jgi:hypothetical protein